MLMKMRLHRISQMNPNPEVIHDQDLTSARGKIMQGVYLPGKRVMYHVIRR